MQAISINNLDKSYGKRKALNHLTLAVEIGEIFGFLGPNGAGKTTTIRCLMNFIRPDSGEVSIFGKDAQHDSVQVKKDIGFLSADNQLYEKWNANQHIEFLGSIRGGENNAKSLLARLDLDPNMQLRHLSSGNKQKLGLILALMNNPRLLVLDEPTKGLDPLLQSEIYTILREYVERGGTVFLSSHNLAEVEHLCTNVGVLREGELVASKSLAEISALNIHIVSITYRPQSKPIHHNIAGAEIISSSKDHLVLKFKGDINPLMHMLAGLELTDIEISHAPLEEIFMEYYRGEPR
ncbi:MAG: ABC transporter ATP-binding protein [Candidatus Saccharimonadia bacterium]